MGGVGRSDIVLISALILLFSFILVFYAESNHVVLAGPNSILMQPNRFVPHAGGTIGGILSNASTTIIDTTTTVRTTTTTLPSCSCGSVVYSCSIGPSCTGSCPSSCPLNTTQCGATKFTETCRIPITTTTVKPINTTSTTTVKPTSTTTIAANTLRYWYVKLSVAPATYGNVYTEYYSNISNVNNRTSTSSSTVFAVPNGAYLQIYAIPSSNVVFIKWTCTGSSACYNGIVPALQISSLSSNITVTGNFAHEAAANTTTSTTAITTTSTTTISSNVPQTLRATINVKPAGYGYVYATYYSSASNASNRTNTSSQATLKAPKGAYVQMSATPENSSVKFVNWTCSGAGCYSGTSAHFSINSLSANITENANFAISRSSTTTTTTKTTVSTTTAKSTTTIPRNNSTSKTLTLTIRANPPYEGYVSYTYTYGSAKVSSTGSGNSSVSVPRGASLSVAAMPYSGKYLSNWTCSGPGCYSGSASSFYIASFNSSITENANFR